MHVIN